ncbi:fibronectin type III-like domain-contianing protein [Polaribacter sp.]|nr:fibronectin type III-like domain-contianing protein [Polaribacter sp.]
MKGFQKVKLKSGEKSIVKIEIPLNSLAFYDETISEWNLEKRDYIIYVGNAANNIFKKKTFSIK